MKKKILMIGTGGTIASKQTEHGLAPGLSAILFERSEERRVGKECRL